MITTDYHMHSIHSADGHDTVDAMCRAAIDRGLAEVGFTEHLDFDRDDPDYGFLDYEAYADAVAEARAAHQGRLTIRMGLEFDFRRAEHVVARGFNMHGDPVTIEGSDLLARCIQHETDHLDGVLFIDRLDTATRKAAMKAIREAEWGPGGAPEVKVSPHPTFGRAF